MTTTTPVDLVVLSADRDIEFAIRGLLTHRAKSLGIRAPTTEHFTHPNHDPGCLRGAEKMLAVYVGRARRALVVFDREGSGGENRSREDLEASVEERLRASGWQDQAAAVVIDPEIEAWVWSDSPHVDSALGWKGNQKLRDWLVGANFLQAGKIKPTRPKEAVEAVLRKSKKQRSSAIYAEIAKTVGLERCSDPAFKKLRHLLYVWFHANE